MKSTQMSKRLRLGLALLAGGVAFSTPAPAAAQTGYSVYQEDPGNALSRHLKTLAESPRNLGALTGAAKAALDLGDAQAAATFYARAEEIAPRDGRIKAGLGSAFLAMEQVQPALKFFEDARALGAPEGEYAADRGLAHDLIGNPAQAQRDYALAMRGNDNDEVRRRMALSKAISGDRAGALAVIDDQLRRQDRAAWRVRAFVLALTGDANGATEAVRAVMPAQAAAMQPFLTRLPTLRPADRAAAVHFGHFPTDASPMQVAEAPQRYASVSPALPRVVAPAAATSTTALRRDPAPLNSAASRARDPAPQPAKPARQGSNDPALSYNEERALLRGSGMVRRRGVSGPAEAPLKPSSASQPVRVAAAEPLAAPPAQRNSSLMPAGEPLPQAGAASQGPVVTPPSASPLRVADAGAVSRPVQGPPADAGAVARAVTASVPQSGPVNILPPALASAPAAASAAAGAAADAGIEMTSLPPSSIAPAPASAGTDAPPPINSGIAAVAPLSATAATSASPPSEIAPSIAGAGLASLRATIEALPDEEAKEQPKPPVKLAKAEPRPEPKKVAESKKDAAPDAGSPSRHWVQIASASDALAAGEYRRLRGKAPKLLADKSGWKASFRSTNRVLVGPFKDQKEAQELVNALAKANIDAVPWKSADGQEIVKLPGK
jgi:tetratricopeptide (TPR) repeat protein